MEALKYIPYLALMICISGVILGASAVSLGQFGDSVDKCWNGTYVYNSTPDACTISNGSLDANADGSLGRNFTNEYWVIWNAQQGESTVGNQLGTVAIIGVMVVIISLIAGVFVYMRYLG